MSRHHLRSIICLGFGIAISGLAGCNTGSNSAMNEESAARSSAGMDSATPAHRSHQFYYYPEAQVYRDCEVNRWYWMEAGQWHFGSTLPSSIMLDTKAPFAVELRADDPTADHMTIAGEYPSP